MLKDITLGQYFPGDTVAHRLDPRTKLILVLLYIVALFQAEGQLLPVVSGFRQPVAEQASFPEGIPHGGRGVHARP